ncbi:response regulator [Pleurocapsales cyanobacterium LEGE 10410]|nr:response regulator [Pleurocapsales cyanobacterium LEGE 10410]
MSLFSQENANRTLAIYKYIIVGGLGSLLLLFLIKRSLPFNRQKAEKYYHDIELAQKEVFGLEKKLLIKQHDYSEINSDLDAQIAAISTAIENLQEIPNFFSVSEQNVIKSQLEIQEALLASQISYIEQLQNAKNELKKSCLYIPELKNELTNNPQLLGSNVLPDNELFRLIDNLFNLSILYCRGTDRDLKLAIENQIKKIDLILKPQESVENKFIIGEFVNYSKKLIDQELNIEAIIEQIELDTLDLKLREIKTDYLKRYRSELQKINRYRLLCSLFFLIIVVAIGCKIISNLARTNRNIVKILEGFTKELESKVEERTAQLEESILNTEAALAQAQNANQAKSRFLANMSHELRTPLNAILGFTQLMTRDSSIGKEQQENLKIINRSGEHLLRLINDILEMSKIEVGQITLNETKFDLHLMLKSIEDMLRLKAEAKNLELTFKIANNVPQYIYTDEGKLRQIVINLLGNALKFTQRGSVTLAVKLENNKKLAEDKIDFLFSNACSLYFSVEDTGPGIEPEEMKQLFTPFEQTAIGRISNEGTGLGLSICKKFVELMGGELKVQSVVGQGSIFAFNILSEIQETQAINTVEQHLKESTRVVGLANGQRKYRILAVDDVPASRLLLNKLLSGIGFLVKEAGNGQEAVELWQEWHPDLILMDMRMPVMDGYEATKRIKSQPQGKKTVIIALTASAFEEERVVILSAGCDDFMRKPFQEEELLEKIGQYLNIDYLYQATVETSQEQQSLLQELTRESLAIMSSEWRSQLYQAAAKVDDQEILQLVSEIPDEYESLAKGLESLVEDFRCDKIIDLTKSID